MQPFTFPVWVIVNAETILAKVAGKKKAKMPIQTDVQLAAPAKTAPEGDLWFHEIKFDGYRMICRIDKGQVSLVTRNHNDWTKRLPSLAEAAQHLRVGQAILDGEIVAMRPDGTTSFQDLQDAFRDHGAGLLSYYVFDLLYLDGYDLTNLPLEERKRILPEILGARGVPPQIRLSEHIQGNGTAFLQQASKMHLEGTLTSTHDGLPTTFTFPQDYGDIFGVKLSAGSRTSFYSPFTAFLSSQYMPSNHPTHSETRSI